MHKGAVPTGRLHHTGSGACERKRSIHVEKQIEEGGG